MPSTVAVARKAVSSSGVSKVLRPFVHGRDEILMVFNVDVHDVVVAIGPGGLEIFLQRGMGAVAGNGEKHVVDAIKPLHILGDALEPVIMGANGLREIGADLVAPAILLDIGPIVLALVFLFGGFTPFLL